MNPRTSAKKNAAFFMRGVAPERGWRYGGAKGQFTISGAGESVTGERGVMGRDSNSRRVLLDRVASLRSVLFS